MVDYYKSKMLINELVDVKVRKVLSSKDELDLNELYLDFGLRFGVGPSVVNKRVDLWVNRFSDLLVRDGARLLFKKVES